jgi:arylsulfatase A-like enzyme
VIRVRLLTLVHGLALALLAGLMACGHEGGAPVPRGPAYDAEGRLQRGGGGAPSDAPNVIVLVVDTLRADAVDPIDPERAAMPFLSALAQKSVCFTQASAPAPWTLPSLTSLLTSRLPHEHGVTGEVLNAAHVERLPTLPEVLRHNFGYRTTAMLGGLGPQVARALGQGFDEASDDFALRVAAAQLGPWAKTRDRRKPFFLMLHTFEAHDPYGEHNHPHPMTAPTTEALEAARTTLKAMGAEPQADELVWHALTSQAHAHLLYRTGEFRAWRADLNRYLWDGLERKPNPDLCARLAAAYRTGLGWVDARLKELHATLASEGLLENTLLIVTGDHGEAFGEHGRLRHGNVLYDEVLRVPLVISGPAPFDRPALIEGSVGLTDIAPTLLELVGAPNLDQADGRSLLALARAGGGPGRAVEAQEERSPLHTSGASLARLASLRSTDWKYVCTHDLVAGSLREEAYDLRSDPEERVNRAGPDGVLGSLPFDEEFCRGVERIRMRFWGQAAQVDRQIAQGYGAGLQMTVTPRPAASCETGESP